MLDVALSTHPRPVHRLRYTCIWPDQPRFNNNIVIEPASALPGKLSHSMSNLSVPDICHLKQSIVRDFSCQWIICKREKSTCVPQLLSGHQATKVVHLVLNSGVLWGAFQLSSDSETLSRDLSQSHLQICRRERCKACDLEVKNS